MKSIENRTMHPANERLLSLDVPVMAHRFGAGEGVYPENSLELLDWVVDEVGVKAVETDVHATSDGVAVLGHNENPQDHVRVEDRDSLPTRWAQMTHTEVLQMQLWQEGKPYYGSAMTLERLLVDEKYKDLVISLDPKTDEAADALVRTLVPLQKDNAERIADRLFIGGFDAHRIESMRTQLAEHDIHPAWMPSRTTDLLKFAVGLNAVHAEWDAYSMPYDKNLAERLPFGWKPSWLELINARSVRSATESGNAVKAWTVDDVDQAQKLAAMGVVLITDTPQVLTRALL